MDDTTKLCCPSCSQPYYLKLQSSSTKGNLPLFLACGHSMCESCVKNIVKFREPIECKVCHHDMVVHASQVALLAIDKLKLYQLFPVNYAMLGELAFQELQTTKPETQSEEKEYFIDLHSILKETDGSQACMECHLATTKMCAQCVTYLCNACFTKTHKNFVIFKNHALKDIDKMVVPAFCKLHNDNVLDFYCTDCKKCKCMVCLMAGGEKSCKNHNVVPTQEVNGSFLDELGQIAPKVDETFKRFTKTAYDVGHLLYNIENETGSTSELTQIIASIEQHFSKLSAIVQKHKQETIEMLSKLKAAEKESLYKAKNYLTDAIKKGKKVIDMIGMTSDPINIKQMNIAVLLEDAKEIADSPWYLNRAKAKKDPLKVVVNEDLCSLISDYIHMEGNGDSAYELCKTTDLGEDVVIPAPPTALVFAPVLPRDVRQNKGKKTKQKEVTPAEKSQNEPSFFIRAPQYRSKSDSVSSLNSCSSDSSQKSSKGSSQRAHKQNTNNAYVRPNIQSVQPFSETQQPKPLFEGAQELVYITHIVNAHNFYVQRSCHQSLVKEMLRQFRNAVSLPKPSINHVVEGKIYLAFNKADNIWQRCRVIKVDKKISIQPLYQVFCFDFGSTETVDLDKLRLVPPAWLQTAPLGIKCALANCVPQTGVWTSDDSYLINNIIDNKQVVINVRGVRPPQADGEAETLECDVTTFEDGVSLAHTLVFHERARMPNPRLKYPQHSGLREKPKIFMSQDDFKYKTMEEVCITHIVSPDKFYVRKRHQQTFYEQLSSELEEEYNLVSNSGTVYLPEKGMSCCVHVPEQNRGAAGAWARAVVEGTPGRGRVHVMLVDSGAPLLAHWSTLRYLHPKYTKLKALATECHLAGVTPLNKRWGTGSLSLMQKFIDRFLELHVEDTRKRGSIGVTLFDRSDPEKEVCINQEMIRHKFAITFGIYSFNKDHEDDLSNQVISNKSPLDKPVRHPKPKPEVNVLKRNTPNEPQKVKASDLEAKDKGPLRLEAKVLQYQSPAVIYISVAHQQKTFSELFETMQAYYSENKPTKKSSWEVGDRCCTVCIQSQTWRRAVIVEIQGDQAKVFYSDFASVETVPISSLVELTPDFANIGDAAIKCHLYGIMPAVGEEWPSLTKEYLKELLDSYRRVFITKLGNFKNKSMPVEIWVYHTIQGGALEPNTSEWRCLNKKIIEQGLGVPDKSEKEAAYTETKAEGGDDMLSFLNVTGSIHDWLQLEPMPTKPLPKLDSPTRLYTSSDQDDQDELEELESSTVMFISDWLPPEPFENKEFTAMPTYIDNDGLIYLHDISQQGTLDLIRKALDVRFKDPDPKAKYQKWVVGEPCVAQYFLDNRFYRGRVLDVIKELSICTIHYIDYGNEEQCSFANMRKSIALHQIPTQAHKCALNRIRPTDNHWDRQTLDYIHKSVVEKQCHVKITGDLIDGITPIELKIDKLWINDHLVDFEMATYVDGSKAVVCKFAPVKRNDKETVAASVTGSDPDYIVEDDSQDSSEVCSVKARDWNKMMEDEDTESIENTFMTYSNDLEDEFLCNITIIQDTKTLELDIVHDDNETLLYEELMKDIQVDAETRPAINGIFEHKACIALFQQDMLWYRASILEYSEAKGKVKVKYVDYGNIEVVDVTDVREIHPEWVKLTPSSLTVKLHSVELNPEMNINVVTQAFGDTFLDKGPFTAKVIQKEYPCPIVELQNEAGELVYQRLIETGVFLKSSD